MSATPQGSRRVVRRRRGPLAIVTLSLIVTAIDAALLALALGGFQQVWAHPRAPALILVWAVAGLTLALLRPVGDQDVLEIARESRLSLISLAFLPVITPATSALGERLGLWMLPGGAWVGWAGVALVALGLTVRIMAMSQLGARFSPLLVIQREHALETTGLYRRVRHPGYLGSLLAALGAVLTFGSGLGLVPLLLFTAMMIRRIRREEDLLAARFGESWLAYRSRSGALLPRP